MQLDEKKFSEFAFDSGLVSKTELLKAQKEAQKTGSSLGEILIKDGLITEDDLRRINANLSGIPFVDLKNRNINLEILQIIPEPISRKHNIIAFDRDEFSVEVALLHMEDFYSIDFLSKEYKLKFLPRFTDRESMREALFTYQKNLKKDFGIKIEKEAEKLSKHFKSFGDSNSSSADLRKIAEDKTISHLVDLFLKHAISQGAVDISLEPQEESTLVRYRIDGILREAFSLPVMVHTLIVLRIKFLAGLDLTSDLPQDGRFKMETNDRFGIKSSFRVNTLPTSFGEKMVLRIIQAGALGFNLETLGFYGDSLEALHRGLRSNTGLVISCGGSQTGKTTTLYTILDVLNKPSVSISTIESPVEYPMRRINQTEVKEDLGLTFLSGLRAILKQDPDVVMVGNIENNEILKLAVNASMSGKLVLVSMNVTTPNEAIEKVLNMGVDLFSLASTLKLLIGHFLVKRLSEDKQEYTLSEKEISKLNRIVDTEKVLEKLKLEKIISKNTTLENIKFFKPLNEIQENAYVGSVGVFEVLEIAQPIKDLILKNASGKEIRSQALKNGMLSFVEDALFKAVQGITTIEEVFRVASET